MTEAFPPSGTELDFSLNTLRTRVDALEGISDTALASRVDRVEQATSALAGAMNDMVAGCIETDDHVTGIQAQVDQEKSRGDIQDHLITILNNTVAVMETTAQAQRTQIASLNARVTNLENRPWPGYTSLNEYAGADATARLRTALSVAAAASDGRKPTIVLPPGTVLAPGTTPFRMFNGASLVGGVLPETEFSLNARVTIAGAAPNGVFDIPEGDTRDMLIANIGWEGPGRSQICRFWGGSGRIAYSTFHGLSFDNFTSVLKSRLIGLFWSGPGYCNNSAETPFEFSGSDYKIWTDGFFLDSPFLKDSDYLLHVKSGNKVLIGSVFVTGDGPTPVRVSGGQMVRLVNLEMEAEGVPRETAGAGLLVTGGNVVVDNAWFFRTMYDPASADLVAAGRNDRGVVHVSGAGTVLRLNNASFGEYNTTPEKPGGHTENHVFADAGATVYANAPLPTNMQTAAGRGGISGARRFTYGKAPTGVVNLASYDAQP